MNSALLLRPYRSRKNLSSASFLLSPLTSIVMVFAVSPGAKVSVPVRTLSPDLNDSCYNCVIGALLLEDLAMPLTVEAVYENGVLKPAQPLPLQEHEKVRVTVEPARPPIWERIAALVADAPPEELAGVQ